MKILIHAHEFNIKEGGPCTKRMRSFAEYFVECGHEVTIITSSHNKQNEKKGLDTKYKILYSYSTKNIKGSNLKRLINNGIFGITSFFKSIFRVSKIDVVITTSPPPLISIFGYLIARIKKAKLIYDVRDIWPDVALEMESFKENSIYYKVFKFIADFMYKKSDYISTVSPRKVEKIKGYCNDSDKVWYVPNGLDDSFLEFKENQDVINKYNLKNKFTTVYIGNVGLAQNLNAMVEIAKENVENSNIQFIVFGDGAYKSKLEEQIKALNLNNILIAGRIDYEDVYTILKYSKVSFVSLKNTKMLDSIPTKMFDALSVGCPVLLFAKGDSCDILYESGLGESAESIDELKQKFNHMFNNYEQYEGKKVQAIEYVKQNYSRRNIAEKFEREVVKNEKEN